MFFTDPAAAFTNIARALRPGGRLVQLVWQDGDRQEWATAISKALSDGSPEPVAGAPFSLADPVVVCDVLGSAGLADAELADAELAELSEPINYGPRAEAYDFVLGLELARDLLARLDAGRVPAALDRLRALLAAHETSASVRFESHAWLVTARRY